MLSLRGNLAHERGLGALVVTHEINRGGICRPRGVAKQGRLPAQAHRQT
ncbi:MAG: hypothetical protein U0X75_24645 [Acidobacteriota bacterium]